MAEPGSLLKAWIAKCVACRREVTLKDDGSFYMTKRTAEWSLRKFEGWSKTKRGWRCERCTVAARKAGKR